MRKDGPPAVAIAMTVGSSGAVMLTSWGCPTATCDHGQLRLPERFNDFGVAVVGDLAVGGDGVVHTSRCRSAWTKVPPSRLELPRIAAEPCQAGCGSEARLAVRGPADFTAAVTRLAAGVHRAVTDYPPARRPGVETELREVGFGRALAQAAARFADHAAAGPVLADAVEDFRHWATALVTEQTRRLHRDGLPRLARLIETQVDPVRKSDMYHAVRHAEHLLPGEPGDDLVCMFSGDIGFVEAALTAAEAVAFGEQGGPWDRVTAVALLPRDLAVLLHADHAVRWSHAVDHPLVFADVPDPGRTDLLQLCRSVASVWGRNSPNPEAAYRAAVSACI